MGWSVRRDRLVFLGFEITEETEGTEKRLGGVPFLESWGNIRASAGLR
jgi:hypothetical protein